MWMDSAKRTMFVAMPITTSTYGGNYLLAYLLKIDFIG